MESPRTIIDLKRLAAEVSVQHGIRVDPDDPMMAVVTLNRLVFEQAIAQVLERVHAAVKDFDAAAEKVQVRAGGALAQEVRDCGLTVRKEIGAAIEDFRRVGPATGSNAPGRRATVGEQRWFVIGMVLSLAIFAVGVWVGTVLR
ncbi:MAG TPA: hypothetical protein VMF91_09925 [Bryobacteraceae bacterium]|nr:hypothetical protein [Bryobacteraceae bacterium]